MYSISMGFFLLAILVILTSGDSISSLPSNEDGTYCDGNGWESYRDEKCYKLIQNWTTRDAAKKMCVQEGLQSEASIPQLATIKSPEEQVHLTEFVFRQSAVTISVWIGAKRLTGNGTKFIWDDGSDVKGYTNWAEGSPTDEAHQTCVVMKSKYTKGETKTEDTSGKWRDVPCEMPNYVICEKLPKWSYSKLQQTLIDTRKELKNIVLNYDPVPVGFIYVQLSGQPEPSTLWSTVQWQDITSLYAGLFFRAEGGDAAQFGTVQEGNAPRVTQVQFENVFQHLGPEWINTTLNVGEWSSGTGVLTGIWDSSIKNYITLKFLQSGGEIRPRNMAMRVWKRIK